MRTSVMNTERAEDTSSRLGEVLYHLQRASQELLDADGTPCWDIIASLNSLINETELEKEKCDDILAEAEQIEIAHLNRQYERSVLS